MSFGKFPMNVECAKCGHKYVLKTVEDALKTGGACPKCKS